MKQSGHQKMRVIAFSAGIIVVLGSVAARAQQSTLPIQYFIFIVQENHSFDNYFGTYPGANGIPTGIKLAKYPGGRLVKSLFLTQVPNVPHDLGHSWTSALLAYDNGAMDGFLWGAYPAGTNYYGEAIPVPTPNPALVQIVESPDSKQSAMRQLRMDGRRISSHGFMDNEDPTEPSVPDIPEDRVESAPSPSASPSPRMPKWAD
jgi:hypothetical protein